MRQSEINNPVQGFTPKEIRQDVEILDTEGVVAIRTSEDVDYHINDDAANQAAMKAGVTVIASSVKKLTFDVAITIEVM